MSSAEQPLKRKRVFVNPAYKDKATILKTSEETSGAYSLGELEVAPGGGNPQHVHTAFSETFTAKKGIIGVMHNNRKVYLRPGESITIPPLTPHYFFNHSDETVVCHVKLQPGHEGFEKGIAIAYGLASDGKANKKGAPKSFVHLCLIIMLTDTNLYGAKGILMPLIKWIAKTAMKNGTEKELLKKYYYE